MKTFKTLLAAAALAFVVVSPAAAIEINFQTPIVDSDGQPVKDDTGKITTLGRVAMISLGSRYQEDANASTDEIYKRGQLAAKVYEAKNPVDLTVEEVAMIKRFIAKAQSPMIVAKAFPMLDKAETPAVKK